MIEKRFRNDRGWYRDKDPHGLTAIIWEYPEENDLQWKVNVLDMEIGQYIYRKRFKTYEAARDFCLLVTNNRAA
jgi:hypothetical protein